MKNDFDAELLCPARRNKQGKSIQQPRHPGGPGFIPAMGIGRSLSSGRAKRGPVGRCDERWERVILMEAMRQ
jgi:hypothetical protein